MFTLIAPEVVVAAPVDTTSAPVTEEPIEAPIVVPVPLVMVNDPTVVEELAAASYSKAAPDATLTALPLPRAVALFAISVPPLTVVAPV
jgi:hypothetical protein